MERGLENFGEGAIIATEAEQVIYWNPASLAMMAPSPKFSMAAFHLASLWRSDSARLTVGDVCVVCHRRPYDFPFCVVWGEITGAMTARPSHA